jgi:hypothetical protein
MAELGKYWLKGGGVGNNVAFLLHRGAYLCVWCGIGVLRLLVRACGRCWGVCSCVKRRGPIHVRSCCSRVLLARCGLAS